MLGQDIGSIHFDQNEWNLNVGTRYRMTKDIIETKMLIGKTKAEVLQILGNDFSANNEKRMSYEVGHVPGLFNIDPYFLELRFENGKVIELSQYEG